MMDELLNRVTEKTGLSPDQAKAAVESVIGFLKEKLPAPLAGELESLVGGGATDSEGLMGDASTILRKMFGNA
jgi:hypothetical protein